MFRFLAKVNIVVVKAFFGSKEKGILGCPRNSSFVSAQGMLLVNYKHFETFEDFEAERL